MDLQSNLAVWVHHNIILKAQMEICSFYLILNRIIEKSLNKNGKRCDHQASFLQLGLTVNLPRRAGTVEGSAVPADPDIGHGFTISIGLQSLR